MALTPKQRSHLKSLAHHLKPLHHVGKEGLSDTCLSAVADAFNGRELIKVKVQEASPTSAREAGPLIAQRIPGVEHVQTIGRTVVLFRRHPEKPEIVLPEGS
jgi:RNA-binding protein